MVENKNKNTEKKKNKNDDKEKNKSDKNKFMKRKKIGHIIIKHNLEKHVSKNLHNIESGVDNNEQASNCENLYWREEAFEEYSFSFP